MFQLKDLNLFDLAVIGSMYIHEPFSITDNGSFNAVIFHTNNSDHFRSLIDKYNNYIQLNQPGYSPKPVHITIMITKDFSDDNIPVDLTPIEKIKNLKSLDLPNVDWKMSSTLLNTIKRVFALSINAYHAYYGLSNLTLEGKKYIFDQEWTKVLSDSNLKLLEVYDIISAQLFFNNCSRIEFLRLKIETPTDLLYYRENLKNSNHLKFLSLMLPIHTSDISDFNFDLLKLFPNLEYLHLGMEEYNTIDFRKHIPKKNLTIFVNDFPEPFHPALAENFSWDSILKEYKLRFSTYTT